jgi:hypothetical protein
MGTGVVDEQIEVSEFRDCRRHHPRDFTLAGHVNGQPDASDPERLELGHCLGLRMTTRDRDIGPLAGQAQGDRATDASASPGNERCFPVVPKVH